MIETVIAAVLGLAGIGGVGVGLAWLNDKRLASSVSRRPVDPAKILEARFAAGEIDEDDFNRRMHRIKFGPPLELD